MGVVVQLCQKRTCFWCEAQEAMASILLFRHLIVLTVLIQLHLIDHIHGDSSGNAYITKFYWTDRLKELTLACRDDKPNDLAETLRTAHQLRDSFQRALFNEVHHLSIKYCGFEQLPQGVLVQFTELRSITIANTELTSLRVEDLPPHRAHLRRLTIESTPIARIDPKLLEAMPQLTSLTLTASAVVEVAHELASAPNLEQVTLDLTAKAQIARDAFNLSRVRE